jgi:DNA-binding IscR family transcriptional regulator
MKNLSNSLHYAVELLSVMETITKDSEDSRPIPLREVVQLNESLPLHFLEQIARKLRIAGILKVVRGPTGGYIISRPCSEITIGQLLGAEIERKKQSAEAKEIPPFKVSKFLEKSYEAQFKVFKCMALTDIEGFGNSKIRRKSNAKSHATT